MAKPKHTARTSAGTAQDAPGRGERPGKSISESAQQIWLAGMGAFHRAQAEGGKLFDTLVRDGLSLERSARRFAGTRSEAMRDALEDTVGQARERATHTWDRLEKAFEDRVQRTLVKLGVPGREDLHDLSARIEQLTAELRKAHAAPATAKPVRKVARKAAPARTLPARRAKAKPTTPPGL